MILQWKGVVKLYDSFTVCCNQIPAVSLQKANTIKSTATSANIEVKLKNFHDLIKCFMAVFFSVVYIRVTTETSGMCANT